MTTLPDIFEALPSSQEIADFVSEKTGRQITDRAVRAWRLEGRGIPGRYWHSIVELARQKDIEGITHEALNEAHVQAA